MIISWYLSVKHHLVNIICWSSPVKHHLLTAISWSVDCLLIICLSSADHQLIICTWNTIAKSMVRKVYIYKLWVYDYFTPQNDFFFQCTQWETDIVNHVRTRLHCEQCDWLYTRKRKEEHQSTIYNIYNKRIICERSCVSFNTNTKQSQNTQYLLYNTKISVSRRVYNIILYFFYNTPWL